MTWHRATSIIAGIGIFLTRLVCGGIMASSHRPPELWAIGPEFRQDFHLDQMFTDYKAGRVNYTVVLPLLGTRIKARVFKDRYRKGDFGFVPLAELGPTPTHVWYYKSGEFDVKQYDNDHLLVHIMYTYVSELKATSG